MHDNLTEHVITWFQISFMWAEIFPTHLKFIAAFGEHLSFSTKTRSILQKFISDGINNIQLLGFIHTHISLFPINIKTTVGATS